MTVKHPFVFINIESVQIGTLVIVWLITKKTFLNPEDSCIGLILNSTLFEKILNSDLGFIVE